MLEQQIRVWRLTPKKEMAFKAFIPTRDLSNSAWIACYIAKEDRPERQGGRGYLAVLTKMLEKPRREKLA